MLIQGILHKQTNQVVKLECSLGQFSVYDAQLQSLTDGSHAGFFELKQLKASMQPTANATLTLEIVAELKAYALLEEAKPDSPKAEMESTETALADPELFGELWPLGKRVKLDETHPHFRAQLKRMKELKERKLYTFIGGTEKVWVKIEQD